MKKQSITREQLKEIHDIACSTWKTQLEKYGSRNPFSSTIEFSNEEVLEMFKTATVDQLPTIKRLFTKPVENKIDVGNNKAIINGGYIMVMSTNAFSNALIKPSIICNNCLALDDRYNYYIVEGKDITYLEILPKN